MFLLCKERTEEIPNILGAAVARWRRLLLWQLSLPSAAHTIINRKRGRSYANFTTCTYHAGGAVHRAGRAAGGALYTDRGASRRQCGLCRRRYVDGITGRFDAGGTRVLRRVSVAAGLRRGGCVPAGAGYGGGRAAGAAAPGRGAAGRPAACRRGAQRRRASPGRRSPWARCGRGGPCGSCLHRAF